MSGQEANSMTTIENQSSTGDCVQSTVNLTHKLSISSSSTSSPKNGPLPQGFTYPYHMSPSTIPGILHFNNFGAIDWSITGLIAYGCQNRIIIVDKSMSFCQSMKFIICQLYNSSLNSIFLSILALHRHKHVVCCVKWSPMVEDTHLASVDNSGVIIVWNVVESIPLTVILSTNETKVVNFFHWIYLDKHIDKKANFGTLQFFEERKKQSEANLMTYKANNNQKTTFLLAFYQQSNCLVLYDAERGEAVVKWQIDYQISHIAFNPFFTFNRSCDSSVPTFLFAFKSNPNDEKLYFGLSNISENDFYSDDSQKEPKKLNLPFTCYVLQSSHLDSSNKLMKAPRYDLITKLEASKIPQHLINVTDGLHGASISSTSFHESLVQIEFHKAVRNQIFIVFSRDIYLVDLMIETIIYVIPLERNCSKIVKIFPCSHRNSFYAFHETGNVSFRLYQKKVIYDRSNLNSNIFDEIEKRSNEENVENNGSSFLNVGYINLCQSEPIRLTKQNKIYGYSVMPFEETRVAFLLSSGRIMIKSLICQKIIHSDPDSVSMGQIVNKNPLVSCLNDLIKPQEYQLGAFLVCESPTEPKTTESISYKILVSNFISGLNSFPTVIRMCPPLTLQNIKKHRPLLAIGDSLGLIQIWLLRENSPVLCREFSIHSYPIAGIEWASLSSFISFSYPTINSPSHTNVSNSAFSALSIVTGSGSSSGRVTNELVFVDIVTGKLSPFRTNRIQDSSPIETIRISHLKQYLIILFKQDDPFEIWDVKSLTLLRVMSKDKDSLKDMTNISAVEWSPLYNKKQTSRNSDSDNSQTSTINPIKENFIVTNRNLFHFSIEGNLVREMSCIPPDSDSGHVTVTSIAWKSDQVLLGDASGTLNLWHLKRKISATEPTFRGYIRKIRFGPGRGNMKCLILYADFGVDIWDINDFKVCSQLKYPRDMNFKIIDVDWASCDLPILCTAEGFIFITDTKLKTYSSSITMKELDNLHLNQLFSNKEKYLQDESMYTNILESNLCFLNIESKRALFKHSAFNLPKIDLKTLNETDLSSKNHSETMVDIKKYLEMQILRSKLFCNVNDVDFWSILNCILNGEELDSRLDLYIDSKHYRYIQQEKLLVLENNRKTYSHACHAYRLNLHLKNFQRAVQILLETESFLHYSQEKLKNVFYVDALKACLIASLQCETNELNRNGLSGNNNLSIKVSNDANSDLGSSELEIIVGQEENSDCSTNKTATKDAVAPVVKLVATSLIANGNILEGVELLNFISKTLDSCRYLQSADRWLDSIWLAKVYNFYIF